MIRFERASPAVEPGASLLRDMHAEIADRLGVDQNADGMPTAGAADFTPPAGVFLVGWLDGRAVCCGGVKRLDQEACEIKRMYVAPEARGQGAARGLLSALEQQAGELGYAVVRLDTHSTLTAARRLYESAGYVEIENFNGDRAADYFGEKRIEPAPADGRRTY